MFKPSSIKCFAEIPKAVLIFLNPFCFFCFKSVTLSCLFLAALWSPAGETLASLCVIFSCVYVTFPYGALGQVWYLIASITDLCRLSYFVTCR